MGIIWKHNGQTVSGPEAIPDAPEGSGSAVVRASYKNPIELLSMGFIADPEDVAEHRKRCPDVDLVIREGSAIPVIRSLGQKRAYLKKMGWVDTRSF